MVTYIYLYLPFIYSSLFTMSLVLFYLDDFKLSKFYILRCIQLFSFICIPLHIFYCTYTLYNMIDVIEYIKNSNDINLHGHVVINEGAGKAISQGLNTIGTQIGLGASIVGIGAAVAKGIAKSSMPPLQKAGVIVASGLITGFGHSIISNINRNNVREEYLQNNITKDYVNTVNNHIDNINISTSKLMNDTISSSPLENLLFDIEGINYTCLWLVIILVIQITFKFYFNDNVNLNLSHILGERFNNNLEYYLNKIIRLNKSMSSIYIWLLLVLLIVGLSFSSYASNELYTNIDSYIAVHNSFKK